MLHQVDPEHGLEWEGRGVSFGANLWVDRLNQSDQRLPGHHLVDFRQNFSSLALRFGTALLIITKAKLQVLLNLALFGNSVYIIAHIEMFIPGTISLVLSIFGSFPALAAFVLA